MKLTPTRREYLFDLFTAAGMQIKTVVRRGDILLAKVRPLADANNNTHYENRQFRLVHDQYNGDRIVPVNVNA